MTFDCCSRTKAGKRLKPSSLMLNRRLVLPRKPRIAFFVEAILYRARVGCPWRDLPKCFGAWDAVYNRFRRWEQIGVWKSLCERLPEDELETIKALFIDSTVIRAHQHAAGAAAKKGGKKRKGSAAAGAGSAPKSTSRQLMKIPLLAS
jgi:transposase